MQHITTTIGTLFQAISELENHKFENDIEFFQKNSIEIETPDGFSKINGLIKKRSKISEITLSNTKKLKCADKHKLFINNNDAKYVDEININDIVLTRNGFQTISEITHFEEMDDVYDIEVDNLKHWYYDANGFLHHNTLMTAAISHAFSSKGYMTITIVPSSDLVEQTYESYVKFGLDSGVYSGDNKDYHHDNVVATWQAIQYNPRILENFECIIWDEAHGIKANVAQKLLNESASTCPFKFGVTGTFPKPEADAMSLVSSIGEIMIEIPAKWLMDNGYLTQVEIEQICLKQKDKESFPDYASERAYLSKNEPRMDVIADLIITKCQEYGNTLVLVNSISFGEKLAKMIDGAVFLYGATKKSERKNQYDQFEENDDIITIATSQIASTGISIDRIQCLILVDAGKSFITSIQSIGRSVRLAAGKTVAHVVDIFADLKWSKKHSKDRKKWYNEAEYPIVAEHQIKI